MQTLRKMGYDVVIINNNPETVSTDYDTASRLYFEPLCPEDVMGVIEVECVVVELDEERKAAMVSNLLVVLCGNHEAQPVVNTGSLY